jgi:hypothetical protein
MIYITTFFSKQSTFLIFPPLHTAVTALTGYYLALQGVTPENPSGPYLEFSTGTVTAQQNVLFVLNTNNSVICGELCTANIACVGIIIVNGASQSTCATVDRIGSAISTTRYSYSFARNVRDVVLK